MNTAQNALVAVAIDKNKSSQDALRWAADNIVERGHTIFLVHVKNKNVANMSEEMFHREMFLPFRCYCARKDVKCKDICLEGSNIAKTIVEFVSQNAVDKLVLGTSSKNTFMRFKSGGVSSSVSKGVPDFCTVYVISRGKPSSIRKAARQASAMSPLRAELLEQSQMDAQANAKLAMANPPLPTCSLAFRRSFSRGSSGSQSGRSYSDFAPSEMDISFVSSGRPSTEYAMRTPRKSVETHLIESDYSGFSHDSAMSSTSSQTMNEAEAEVRRLKQELKQTMDMYNMACSEALTARQKAGELQRWKTEEEQKMQEMKMTEENALAMAERERAKCEAIMEATRAAQKIIADKEAQARKSALREESVDGQYSDVKCRRYSIGEIEKSTNYFEASRKIGEGGYGPVFKGYLDHTMVAIKVLRPDAAQGRSQFQKEVEVLSCIRHPNMVLLLGACPEYGCLVYEYMANGSLEDRLFRRGNTPVLSWKARFRIAAEIATALLFLHQTKPEPLVHRDLKPANILLDHNMVSKISDVGLARLIPCNAAENEATQYHMTSAAGTFCYIDPEYQQTGLLGVKSDVYSFGIMLLQIITSKPPMGLAHHVEMAIEKGKFATMLDPTVTDWPLEETLCFAKIAIRCAELRRRDRPDLSSVVLPELNKLRELASI